MMSSVSPLHPISKLVNPGPSGTFYGLGPSSVTTTGETVSSSPSTVNCIGVNLSPSLFTTSSSSLSSTTIATNLTTTTISTNSIVNLINCSTPLPSLQNSPSSSSSTIDSGNHNISHNITNTIKDDNKSIGKDPLKANVPYSWKREKINGSIVYISPSNCFLWSHQDVTDYLLTEGTCKCGLECPIILEEIFNFDPRSPSISLTPVNNCNNNLDEDKRLNCKTNEDHTFNENHFHNNNPINAEYPPKTCNHRRRDLIETSDYSSNHNHHHHHHHHHINANSNDSNFSTASSNTTNTTTTTVNDTRNQINVRLTHEASPIPEATNQSLQHQHFTDPNHVNHPPAFHHHHHQQQQQLTTNSIPFYPSTHHQSIINPGVTIFKSDANFNDTRDKEPSIASSSYSNDHHPTNIPKDFQHNSNPSPLTTNSYINWLPLNSSDDNRLTAIVNESQSNVQAFANSSSSSLPGFADVISGMSLAPTLIDPHNPGGGQLVQLYNPVQYTSVPPNAVALLSPAQNLNRDGSATILIPSLMQSTDHHHHHHHQQQQPIVLNSTENVSTTLDHQTRSLLPSLRSTPFSPIPIQTPYAFQPQLADSYSESSPSPTQSYTVTPTSINDNSVSNDNSSDNSNHMKSKSKSKLIKRRSPRNRKAKENNQRLNRSPMVTGYFNQRQQDPEKLVDQVIKDKETMVLDESSSRLRLINDNLINEFDDDDDEEDVEGEGEGDNSEPMDSQDCEYEENQFTSQTEDDKDDFEYERIDDSAQCTSEDIMRELSSNENSTIRNVGVQSDELIGESESLVKSTDCSNEMIYSSNDRHKIIKSITQEEEEDDEVLEEEEDENDDDDYSIHSNLPDSEESSEKDDKINNLKTTCEFVLQDDEVNDSFNELDDDIDDDEFELDGNTNDNDLLSSDDISVNFVNSDNNNNLSINSDINSFDDEDDLEDFHSVDNYDNPNTLISITQTMTTTTTTITKQLNKTDVGNDDNYEEEDDGDDKVTIATLINPSSTTEKPADEGLYERLSNSNKTTTAAKIDEESTKNRNNKRLERLRKELLCYENNFDQTTAQSPPLSPQVRTFETGDLVWGQMRGNPSWPGKLISKDDVPGNNNGQAEKGKVWVKWFGDNLVTQVELDKLKTLSEGLEAHHTARKKHRKGKKTDSCLDQAIQEAMMELDKQIDQQPLSSTKTTITSKSHQPKSSSSPSQPPPSSSSSSSSLS